MVHPGRFVVGDGGWGHQDSITGTDAEFRHHVHDPDASLVGDKAEHALGGVADGVVGVEGADVGFDC